MRVWELSKYEPQLLCKDFLCLRANWGHLSSIPKDKLQHNAHGWAVKTASNCTHSPAQQCPQAVKYHVKDWAPDPKVVETYGTSEAVLNHAQARSWNAQGGRKDETAPYPFKFEEQGPGLVAVTVDSELDKIPGSAVLQEWVRDLWCATVYHCESVNSSLVKSIWAAYQLGCSLHEIPEPIDGKNSDANSEY